MADPDDDVDSEEYVDAYDIDTPIYAINQSFQRSPHASLPRLPRNTWHSLQSKDQAAWDKLTNDGKQHIINDLRTSMPHNPTHPPRPAPNIPPGRPSKPRPSPQRAFLADSDPQTLSAFYSAFQAFCEGSGQSGTEILEATEGGQDYGETGELDPGENEQEEADDKDVL